MLLRSSSNRRIGFRVPVKRKIQRRLPVPEFHAATPSPKLTPLFRRDIAANLFGFLETDSWIYQDCRGEKELRINTPHLVLTDGCGINRCVLGWRREPQGLVIHAVQRLRIDEGDEFREKLGMIHPADFLIMEFIFRNREAFVGGTRIFLEVEQPEQDSQTMRNYWIIKDRFFAHRPMMEGILPLLFPLSVKKERVKNSLTLV